MSKLSETTFPQKLFSSDCITLYYFLTKLLVSKTNVIQVPYVCRQQRGKKTVDGCDKQIPPVCSILEPLNTQPSPPLMRVIHDVRAVDKPRNITPNGTMCV